MRLIHSSLSAGPATKAATTTATPPASRQPRRMLAGAAWLLCTLIAPMVQGKTPELAASSTVGDAAELSPAISRPYGDCRLGAFSSNRNLDEAKEAYQAACLLNWKPKLSGQLHAGFSARLAGLAGPVPASRRAPSNNRLREGFLQFDRGDWTVRLGRQHIVWGRADRISPTDVLSPRDYTFLSGDDDEQRNGLDAALARVQLGAQWSATALVSRFEAHVMPQGALPANLLKPATQTRAEWGLRLDRTGSGWDGSLSYFDGLDRTPRYWAGPGASGFSFERRHERQRMLGIDLASSTGRWTFRGEAAFSKMSPDCDACPLAERNVSRWVLGADRDFGNSSNVNVQVFGVTRSGYKSPESQASSLLAVNQGLDRLNSEFASRETGMTVRLSSRFLDEKLKVELAAIREFTHGSWVIRPRMSYAWSDTLSFRAGADHFVGDAQTYFGSRKKNSIAFVEAAVVF